VRLGRVRHVAGIVFIAAAVAGCGWLAPSACRKPILVAVVPEEGSAWWLSYECFWWGDDIVVSADGYLTTGDWSSFPQSCHVAPAPEAMVAVGDRVLMAAGGKAYVLSREGDELAAQQVGQCPQDVRQMTVIPAAGAADAVSLAILAGGQYEESRLKRADIFLATLKDGRLEVEPSGYNPSWHPWLLQAGKMGGHTVLFVGALKAAHFDDRERNRPQLFEIVSTEPLLMRPMWLGTSLSRPFANAVLVDIDGDSEDELVAVEWTEAGDYLIQLYAWRGSGFEGIALINQTYAQPPAIAASALKRGEARQSLLVRSGERLTAFALMPRDEHQAPRLVARKYAEIEAGASWVVIPGPGVTPPCAIYKNSEGHAVFSRFRPTPPTPPAASAQTP